MKNLLILLLLPFGLVGQNHVTFYGPTVGRQVIASAGTVLHNNNIQISYTIGENFISYYHSGNTIITEGFQRGEVVNYSRFDDKGTEVTVIANPNPTTGTIRLAFKNDDLLDYRIGIFDMDGKLFLQDRCIGESIDIDMRKYPAAMYKVFFFTENGKGAKQRVISIQKMD